MVDLVVATRELADAAAELESVTDELCSALALDASHGGGRELDALPSLCDKVSELTVKVRTLRAVFDER